MEVGFDKWHLAHRDIYSRIRRRMCIRRSVIVEDGYADAVIETENCPTPNMR
jgi:hypothetical protein